MIDELKQKRLELLREAEHLRAKIEQLESQGNDVNLAEIIHSTFCHHNHADACDWYYNSWKNPEYARNKYLNIARKVLVATHGDFELAQEIVNSLKGA
jgi:hypothetical protein